MTVSNIKELDSHVGHDVEVVRYGRVVDGEPENVSVECRDCHEVLFEYDSHF